MRCADMLPFGDRWKGTVVRTRSLTGVWRPVVAWICQFCGLVHVGEKPPELCSCGKQKAQTNPMMLTRESAMEPLSELEMLLTKKED